MKCSFDFDKIVYLVIANKYKITNNEDEKKCTDKES